MTEAQELALNIEATEYNIKELEERGHELDCELHLIMTNLESCKGSIKRNKSRAASKRQHLEKLNSQLSDIEESQLLREEH